MKTTLEKIENNIVKVTVTVEAEQLTTAVNEAYKKNVKQFNIPGYRKGHNSSGKFFREGKAANSARLRMSGCSCN